MRSIRELFRFVNGEDDLRPLQDQSLRSISQGDSVSALQSVVTLRRQNEIVLVLPGELIVSKNAGLEADSHTSRRSRLALEHTDMSNWTR